MTMFDLTHFTLSEMSVCSRDLRSLGNGAHTMEEVAARTVRYLYDSLNIGRTSERACALVRCYKTHAYGQLEPQLQAFARAIAGDYALTATTPCLTLLATAGDLDAWNVRQRSEGHQAIPLLSEEAIARLPMVAQLVHQLGLAVQHLLTPAPALLADLNQRMYNVFYVQEATGSPYVPAQAGFVTPHGIHTVLGFGGVLPNGDLLAIILFTRVTIDRAVADLFKPLALSVKLAMLPFVNGPVFVSDPANRS
jgi:two-component system, NtrC family, sensor kinase